MIRNTFLSLWGCGLVLAILAASSGTQSAAAEEAKPIEVIIKDHRFVPAEIHVPVGKATMLVMRNADTTAEEFESSALKVEKVIVGGNYATIRLRPLGPGKYPFMGEYHADTAQGVVIAE